MIQLLGCNDLRDFGHERISVIVDAAEVLCLRSEVIDEFCYVIIRLV
jgi:hypothetical protein